MLLLQAILESHNKRQHIAPAALDSQQVARLCGGRYIYGRHGSSQINREYIL
jgi:hypothetical protein